MYKIKMQLMMVVQKPAYEIANSVNIEGYIMYHAS